MNQSINTDSKNEQQKGTTTEVPPWNGQYKNTGGLKPVLRDPNLALSFCYMTRIIGTELWNIKQTLHPTMKHLYWELLIYFIIQL